MLNEYLLSKIAVKYMSFEIPISCPTIQNQYVGNSDNIYCLKKKCCKKYKKKGKYCKSCPKLKKITDNYQEQMTFSS